MTGVTVRYHTPLRQARGLAEEQVALPSGASLAEAVVHLAERGPAALRGMLLGPEGDLSPHLVLFHNGSLATGAKRQTALADGDEIKLFLAISGG